VPITFEVTGSWLGRPPQWTKLPCSGYNEWADTGSLYHAAG